MNCPYSTCRNSSGGTPKFTASAMARGTQAAVSRMSVLIWSLGANGVRSDRNRVITAVPSTTFMNSRCTTKVSSKSAWNQPHGPGMGSGTGTSAAGGKAGVMPVSSWIRQPPRSLGPASSLAMRADAPHVLREIRAQRRSRLT